MRTHTRSALALLALVLLAGPALAQVNGTLRGTVTSTEGALPGVTVTVDSPALQGTRSTQSGVDGGYYHPFLPPGEYEVTFEMQGFKTTKQSTKISAAQDTKLDIALELSDVAEEIVVTGTYETISASGQAATTHNYKDIEKLAVNRNIRDAVLLTPGVAATGPAQGGTPQISIAGAPSFENLFLVNGVVVNENLRGQPFDLFIEDALEETTTSVSGVSAEFGRFTGGVVNAITKSGGNDYSGSLRVNFTNDDWASRTELSPEREDKVNETYEGTLGGFLLRDKAWVFGAVRDLETTSVGQTVVTRIPYARGRDQKRYEGKLTLSPFQGHRLVGSYLEIDDTEIGNRFTANIMDVASQHNRQTPQELKALNYTGVLTSSFFVEAQYSEREFAFVGSGSQFTDRIKGTLFVDNSTGFRWHSPTFCGVCIPEERNNTNLLAKGSWFLSSESLGSHDIAFGYDTYEDIRAADNHQSGSDFRIIFTGTHVGPDGVSLFPVFSPNLLTVIQFNPIFISTKGSSFNTDSFYLNDRWRLNDHWSFNLGVRYDENDGQDQEGKTVAKDSKISPRLGVTFDPWANGSWLFNASYGTYVAAIANNIADSTSAAGNPATFQWNYRGPAINVGGPQIDADTALQMLWDWFDSVGGVNNTSFIRFVNIPGGTSAIKGGSLSSPDTEELTLGVTKRLGNRGLVRSDYVRREGNDFYSSRIDLSTGSVITPTGSRANFALIENEDTLRERVYDGLHTQFQYRFSDRLSAGGNWTWSHARGTFDGETGPNATVTGAVSQFPEYKDLAWSNKRGPLDVDQRHRVRIWGLYDIFRTDRHTLNVSVLQNYASGRPYSAAGTIDTRSFVANPGYAIPPATVTYFFSERGGFQTPDITSTDLALNYSFYVKAFGEDIEMFLQPEVFNAFNEDGFVNVNTTVQTRAQTTALQLFNPFTTEPVEGVHWRKGANFGRPNNEFDFQTPRTFRFSVGVRF